MKRIRVLSYQSTGLDPNLSGASVIDIEDARLGSGGFGVAHRALLFDGKKVTPQVVKLLTANKNIAQRGFDTIQELQRKLSNKNNALAKSGVDLLTAYPALHGVPQLSFEGEMNGDRVLGYSANDLTAAGFEEFSALQDDTARFNQFLALPVSARFRMALQLVTAFRLLSSELNFIHADIKAEAIFVDVNKMRCAVIDYDGGAVTRSLSDTPVTYGTLQEWLAPEIMKQLNPANASGRIKVDFLSDVWPVNFAIHYMLVGLPPFSFFTEISERSMKAYGQHFHWPNADSSFPYFDRQQAALHAAHVQRLGRLPPDIVKQFEFTFTYGFLDPNQRTSCNQWESVLQSAERPVIHSFQADRTFVDDTLPVRLTWKVSGAAHLELKGVADVTGKTAVDVQVRKDTVFELVLTSFSGQQISKTIHIRVSKAPPVIHSFKSSRLLLTDSTPVELSWRVSGSERIQIDNGIGNVTGRTSIKATPKQETVYTLTSISPFGVSAHATVQIKISKTPPAIVSFTADRTFLTDKAPVLLNWLVSDDAYETSINEVGTVSKQGRVAVAPRRDTTYVLTAQSYFGYSALSTLQVTVSKDPPIVGAFEISPAFLREGMNATVRWKVENAEEVFLDPAVGAVPTEGHLKVCIPPSGRFLLRAVSYFGMAVTKEASVIVLKKTTLTSKRTELTRKRTVLLRPLGPK